MASLVIGAAGAAIGGAFFGPLGASIGWMVGSAVGSILDPQKQQGPRLTDLKLQGSQYGQMRPILYGSMRVSGQVIWETDLKEHPHVQGGKGGPTITTYTYSASFAVRLCDGPIVSVLRVWADGQLIYDMTTGQGNNAAVPITIYLGTETQLPDPTMEAELGVGQVNANRGVAYCVFTDWDLGDYGNRVPALTFEVCTAIDSNINRVSTWPNALPQSAVWPAYSANYDGKHIEVLLPITGGPYWAHSLEVKRYTYTEDGTLVSYVDSTINDAFTSGVTYGFVALIRNSGRHVALIDIYNTGSIYKDGAPIITGIPATSIYDYLWVMAWDESAFFWIGGTYPGPRSIVVYESVLGVYTKVDEWEIPHPEQQYLLHIDNDGTLWLAAGQTYTHHVRYTSGVGCELIHTWDWGAIAAELGVPQSTFAGFGQNAMYCNGDVAAPRVSGTEFYVDVKKLTTTNPYLVQAGEIPYVIPIPTPVGQNVGPIIPLSNGLGLIRDGLVSVCSDLPGGILLADIVADVSDKCGLAADDYDVSELTDIVPGYIIASQMTGRSAIEPLMVAYHFDAVESDAIVKFPKRGRSSVVTLDPDDMGAFSGGGSPPARYVTTRMQDVELPRIVNVVYYDTATDYQQGTQSDIRAQEAMASDSLLTIQLPIALSSTEARGIAQAALFNAWVERDHYHTALPTKYAYLDPCDVVTLNGTDCRIVSEDAEPTALQTLDLTRSLASVWYTTGSGGNPGSGFPEQTVVAQQLADLVMLDIPVITDTSQQSIYYAAMAGQDRPVWKGGALFKSLDGGVTFSQIAATNAVSSIGTASTVLGDFAGNWFDELNSVTILMAAGANDLESVSEINVLNGQNLAVLGNEIIQYKSAVLTAPQTYVLTGLLRGRHGTEWATGGHAVGDRFVLLPVETMLTEQSGDLGNRRDYKAATYGTTLDAALDVPFTYSGAPLRCFAPVQLGGGRDGSGNITLNWVRRARINGEWVDGSDVPLDESTESYTVTMYSSGTYATAVASYTATAPTFDYSTAAQTTDFGSAVDPLYWSVAQVSTHRGSATKAYGAT